MRLLPGVAALRGYQRSWLRGDLLAGLAVAAYLIPTAAVLVLEVLYGVLAAVGLSIVELFRYDAPLCFANAEDFRRRALAAAASAPSALRWFLLNAEANVEVDSTAADTLAALHAECERRGVVFAMARVKQDLRDQLARAGLIDTIGEERIFMTLPTAVAAYRSWHHQRFGPLSDDPTVR
jgi:MFS superfamily sulfate permease-like transporter